MGGLRGGRVQSRVMKRAIVLTLWAFVAAVRPAGAQGVGAISGTVVDTSGGVLPGVTGAYEISVSGTMQYYTGFPELTTVSVGNNTVSLTQGTTVVAVAARGDTRLPAVRSLDMTLRRTFRFGTKTIEPRLDLFNLTNAATILARTNQLGPTYGQASSIQRGTLIKEGFGLLF